MFLINERSNVQTKREEPSKHGETHSSSITSSITLTLVELVNINWLQDAGTPTVTDTVWTRWTLMKHMVFKQQSLPYGPCQPSVVFPQGYASHRNQDGWHHSRPPSMSCQTDVWYTPLCPVFFCWRSHKIHGLLTSSPSNTVPICIVSAIKCPAWFTPLSHLRKPFNLLCKYTNRPYHEYTDDDCDFSFNSDITGLEEYINIWCLVFSLSGVTLLCHIMGLPPFEINFKNHECMSRP